MKDEDFAKIVRDTIEKLPDEFKSQLDNVDIVIDDWPREGDIKESSHYFLLGLYRGVPKTERSSYSALPDKITIFKEPLLRISRDQDDAKKKIEDTVLHELGHHFGLSDEDLRRVKR